MSNPSPDDLLHTTLDQIRVVRKQLRTGELRPPGETLEYDLFGECLESAGTYLTLVALGEAELSPDFAAALIGLARDSDSYKSMIVPVFAYVALPEATAAGRRALCRLALDAARDEAAQILAAEGLPMSRVVIDCLAAGSIMCSLARCRDYEFSEDLFEVSGPFGDLVEMTHDVLYLAAPYGGWLAADLPAGDGEKAEADAPRLH